MAIFLSVESEMLVSLPPRFKMYSKEAGKMQFPEVRNAHIFIRTFGYFDVFVDGVAILFRSEKAKELLALLVDRRGGYVSSSEAISILWENEPLSDQTRSRYRKVAMRLKDTLEQFGVSEIMESTQGKRRIIADNVECDLFDYLIHGESASSRFLGSYLRNYSWGEITLSELMYLHEKRDEVDLLRSI